MRYLIKHDVPRWKSCFALLPHHCMDIDGFVWLEWVWKKSCYSDTEPMAGSIYNSAEWTPPETI